jgi:hypothetical protein
MHPVPASIYAHECFVILNCSCRLCQKKESLARSEASGATAICYLSVVIVISVVVSVAVVPVVTVAIANMDNAADFAAG